MWRIDTICCTLFCFQAEDGIRDLVRSRGLGDVYKRQVFAVSFLQIALPQFVAGEIVAGDAAALEIADDMLSLIHI